MSGTHMPRCQHAACMLHSSGAHECGVQRTMVKEPPSEGDQVSPQRHPLPVSQRTETS
jgi:hypothetical protein